MNPHPDTVANFGLILLAAGKSSRLGQAKQLLPYQGQPLLRRAAETALASRCRPVVVVLGSAAEACTKVLAGLPVQVVFNAQWAEGLSSSIRAGIAALATVQPDAVGVILCVADQPQLTAELLSTLIERQHVTGARIVACEYGRQLGVPVLFCADFFHRLKSLTGDKGARDLLREQPDAVARIPFPGGLADIDTPQDRVRHLAEPSGP